MEWPLDMYHSTGHVLPCIVWSLMSSLSRIFQSYHNSVWLQQGTQCSLLLCCLNEVSCLRHATLLLLSLCFTALRHILGHSGCGQLTYPHCSWTSILGSLPVLSGHSFASNRQLPFLNQRKGENGHRNSFMTKSQRKNVLPDWGLNPRPSAYQPDTHLIELPCLATLDMIPQTVTLSWQS